VLHPSDRLARDARSDTADLLEGMRRSSLLRDLPTWELESLLANCVEHHAENGDLLLKQRGRAAGLCLILSGQVSVRMDGVERARLDPGELVGEMSTLLAEDVVADVAAVGAAHYLVLDGMHWKDFLVAHPVLMFELLKMEARRLRAQGLSGSS
jgi:CRP-like cAMP-binding protein